MINQMYRSVTTDNYDFVGLINGKTRKFHTIHKEGLSFHMPPADGDDADEVTRTLYDDCVLPEDREMTIENALVAGIKAHLAESNRFVFTYRMRRPDGSLRHKKITQYYIDPLRELIAVMREDLTEIIQTEAEKNRLLSDALDASNRAGEAKSMFLSRVSHELRTPLNAIIGFMDLAKDASQEQMAEYLRNSDMVAENIIQQKFGAICECAEDGRIALEMFLSRPERYYDAILMDIQMPNMDGYEATRRIRASGHSDSLQIQIIALSANAFAEDITKSLASGMNTHISKPIEPDVLGEALEKAYVASSGCRYAP